MRLPSRARGFESHRLRQEKTTRLIPSRFFNEIRPYGRLKSLRDEIRLRV